MALKYAAHSQFAAPKVDTIQVTAYVKDERDSSKKFKYEMLVEWSDDARYELYRLYSDFYEFQSELEAMFPVQAGQISEKERILPSLPSKKSGLFRSNLTPTEMKDKMQEYIKQLLALDEFIIRSSVVCSFFKPRDEYDHKLRGKGKNASMHPLAMPGGVQIEEYVAIGDFTAKPQSNQLSVKKGQVVNVLVREGGWWFCETEGKSGWAPSTYLAQLKEDEMPKDADGMVQPISERNEGKYRAISEFIGGEGQHSCQTGDLFLVLDRDPDGWWLALKLGLETVGELAEAWIPAAYLESLDDDAFEESQELEPEKFVVTERYSAKNGDEITLEEGDSIEVLKKNQDGWWFVRQGENSGFFPAYNIQPVIDTKKPPLISDSTFNSQASSMDSVTLTRRNVAASTTVFNKVKDFGVSKRTRGEKKKTVRYPPPRMSTIVVPDSISDQKFTNFSRSIRSSVSSLDTAFTPGPGETPSPIPIIIEGEAQTLKEDLQVASPAPVSEVPTISVDETEVTNVRQKARQTAFLRKKDSLRNVQLLVKQVEQKKRAISFNPSEQDSTDQLGSPKGESWFGFESLLRKQDLNIDGLKTQVSDLNLVVIQLSSKMDRMEQVLDLIAKKLETDKS